MLCYCTNREEGYALRGMIKDLAARYSEEQWDIHCFLLLEEVRDFLSLKPLVNMACFDVSSAEDITFLGEMRRDYREMRLMLLASASLSPMEYVRPDILASSLVLRPFHYEVWRDKLKSMILEYLSHRQEDVFLLNTREGRMRVPYNQIYYMEARNKKVYLRLQFKEIAFYATIDELEETLPDFFLRCHRSFLVNGNHIENVRISQGQIDLAHDMTVPLSRSYKMHFKDFK